MTPSDIKKFRKENSMTQKALADHLGVSKVTVTKWESGSNPIPKSVELALDKQEINIPLDLAERISDYSKRNSMTFNEAFAELIRKALCLGFLLTLGYLAFKSPQKTVQVGESLVGVVINFIV